MFPTIFNILADPFEKLYTYRNIIQSAAGIKSNGIFRKHSTRFHLLRRTACCSINFVSWYLFSSVLSRQILIFDNICKNTEYPAAGIKSERIFRNNVPYLSYVLREAVCLINNIISLINVISRHRCIFFSFFLQCVVARHARSYTLYDMVVKRL